MPAHRLFILLALLVATSRAQASPRISVGSDLSPWFFSGFSLLLSAEVEELPRWRISAELWAFDFPDAYVELRKANRDEDWRRRADLGVALYFDRQLSRNPDEGAHVGVLLNAFHSTVKREGQVGQGQFWSAEALLRLGYRWFPGEQDRFFLDPWLGAGPIIDIGNDEAVGGQLYREMIVQAVATVHAGWRF